MKYREWAPKTLVEQYKTLVEQQKTLVEQQKTLVEPHKRRIDGDQSASKFKVMRGNPDGHIPGDIPGMEQKKHRDLNDAETEAMKITRKFYRLRGSGGLPDKERIDLLKKLITFEDMNDVWTTLAKYATHENYESQFFGVCLEGITGWRGDQQQTAAERRLFYQKIHDAAVKLQGLMDEASAFDCYSVTDLICDEMVDLFIESLEESPSKDVASQDQISDVWNYLDAVMPSISDVLEDIGEKAKQYADEPPIAKKPNSDNGKAHYFIRVLSAYCRQVYRMPLHDVVAKTTTIIFGLPNCDYDYVRKIVEG